MGISEESLF